MIETASASASGSLIAYALLKLWKSLTRRIKVRGLLINDRENWDKLEPFSNEDILFINLKKMLGKDYPADLSRSDIRLKVFPLAKRYVNKLKDSFKKKTFVIITDDRELLNYLSIKNKFIKAILPSESLIQELHKVNKETDYNKLKLEVASTLDKKDIHILDTNEDLLNKVREIFKISVK